MVTTRSMSRIAAEGASKQTRERESIVSRAKPVTIFQHVRDSGETLTWSNWTIRDSACCLFMKDYVKQYYVNHPPRPTRGTLPHEVNSAGQLEWRNMSATEQAPWIKMVKEASALRHFMNYYYVKQYYEKHPVPRPTLKLPSEVINAGKLEWRNMSATEKAPWIKMAKEKKGRRAEGPKDMIYN